MKDRFAITREDGRSNAQVILDYVKDGKPGRLYTYKELASALSIGSRPFTHVEVQAVVNRLTTRLLREQQRRLHVVTGMGYRLSPAAEHMTLAHADRRRADIQLKKGLETLRHVRFEEMDENTRKAHEGHLMIHEALYQNQVAIDRRLRRIEDAIAGNK